MNILYLIMFFILGTVFGSFFNVLATRIPQNESIIRPGSHCEKCGHKLKWYELIPILSFIFQKGRCTNCKTQLSLLYPFSEIALGLLFMISYYSFGFSYELMISIILSSVMILVTVSDLTYLMIPDRFIFIPIILILIIKLVFLGTKAFLLSIFSGFLCFLIMYLIMKFGEFIFKKECLGGADVKLMILSGVTLEPFLSLLVIIIASFIALPVSLLLLFKHKENIIPFGPFLVIGILIIFFLKLDTMSIVEFLLGRR